MDRWLVSMIVTYLCVVVVFQARCKATVSFGIGAMLSSSEHENIFNDAVKKIDADSSDVFKTAKFNASSSVLSPNPIHSAMNVCENVIAKGVVAVIVSHPKDNTSPPISISYACSFYHIPVIGISARETIFSDKSLHDTFLRTVPSYSDQAYVWLGLLRHFRWNKVILLTSNDQDSRMIATKFTGLAERNKIKIEKTILFQTGCVNATSQLVKLIKMQSQVILFSASEEDATVVYQNAFQLGITRRGYVWLVTEQSFTGTARNELPQGAVGMRLSYGNNESAQVQDAVSLVAKAINRLLAANRSLTPPTSSCKETSQWHSGQFLFHELVNTTLENGRTGKLLLNGNGDRINSVYQILNLKSRDDKELTVVGEYRDGQVSINEAISWPGGGTERPEGFLISTHLNVVTLVGEPFVFITTMPSSGRCEDLDTASGKERHIKCSGKVYGEHAKLVTSDKNDHCCYGFCMDLLKRLAKKVNFTFDVHLSEDGSYGSLRRVNGTDMKRWNGMVGEVIDDKSDLIVAALTINNERAEWIEFSKPFKYQGLTILVKKDQSSNRLDSFLRPFQINLWLLVLLSVHIVAVILYLLDRFSPFGRFKLARKEKEETALNLSSAMWFSWGVLLNSGIGEGTPRSFSARVLGMVWAGFAMIIVASYTANLAAFLVLDRPKAVVSGIDDPNLRNPSGDFKYATVANSSVDAYFRRQVELSSMYTFMEKYNVKTAREAIQKVKNNELKAFIWDSPVLYYEASQDCMLTIAGELFGRSGYGIGMPKGSPWTNNISLAILNFHESGVMEELETTWIDSKNCAEQSNSPATLGLSHMLGVFIMVAAGIGAGVVIIILEILYHKHRGWKEEQKEIAKKTTDKWRANILMMKKERATNGRQPNGVLDSHAPQTDGIARRNPIYNPENHVDGTFTYT